MSIIKKEDYTESCCPLKRDEEFKPIPIDRVIRKLDSFVNAKEFEAAEKHLKYWITEAEAAHDDRGKLTLLNEEIGLFRKCSQKEKALDAAQKTLELLNALGLEKTITAGTSYINAATAYNAFGDPKLSFEFYKKAQKIYEENLSQNDERLGGLYNNMALSAQNLEQYDEAAEYFNKALTVMNSIPGGNLEAAITHCNIADLLSAVKGPEDAEKDIEMHLDEAMKLLDLSKDSTDGYYAFVCEKCAPVFEYYGYFLYKKNLQSRADAIYLKLKNA